MGSTRTTIFNADRPPGHARVLGFPGCGKTTALVARHRALVARGHSPLIIAFGAQQRDQLLDAVLSPESASLGRLPVTTHGHLASVILSAARPGRARTLRDVDEMVVLDRVLARGGFAWASDLASISDSDSFRRALLQILHLLAQNGVTEADARAAITHAGTARAADVLAIHAAYRNDMDARGLVTFYDAAWRAAEALSGAGLPHPLAGADVLLIDDFQDLDAGQFHLIETLAPPQGSIAVEVFGDPTGARFAFRGTSERFLLEEFPRRYTPADFTIGAPQPADPVMMAVLDEVSAATAAGAPWPRSASGNGLPLFERRFAGARAFVAADEIAEAQQCAVVVGQWIRDGVAPRDIAIIARETAPVRAALLLSCRDHGVPLDAGDEGPGFADELVQVLVGALGRDETGRHAESLAASPLLPVLVKAWSDASTPPEAVAHTTGAARWIVRHLRRSFADARDGLDLAKVLRACASALPPREGAVVLRHAGEWDRYVEVVARAGGRASADEFLRHYVGAAACPASGGARVALLSARESSGRAFRAVALIGAAEGVFPAAESRQGYMPVEALAAALAARSPGAARDLGVRADRDEAARGEHALLLTALTRAREHLCVSAPARAGSDAAEPARVLSALFSGAGGVLPRAHGAAARAVTAVARADKTPANAALAGACDPVMGRWLVEPAPGRLPRAIGSTISASGLEAFFVCPRRFFYARLLRVPEPDSIHLAIGNLFHGVLKDVVVPGMTRAQVNDALASAETVELLERAIASEMAEHGEWVRALSRHHLVRMLALLRAVEADREGDYRVLEVEKDVEFSTGGTRVRGRIDRVDEVAGLGAVIVDYKASKSVPKRASTLRGKIEEKRKLWQVPLYREALERAGLRTGAFLYYSVPPGEDEAHVSGLRTGDAPAPRAIKNRFPRGNDRWDTISAQSLDEAVALAIATHESIVRGQCDYVRTEERDACQGCAFAGICQRTAGLS